jgi:hypothetical protein
MQIKILPALPSGTIQERLRALVHITRQVEQSFPWKDKLYLIEPCMHSRTILLRWVGPLTEDQIQWLQTASVVLLWRWSPGGTLSFVDQRVSVLNRPCTFAYKQEASFYISSFIGMYVSFSDGTWCKICSDEELHQELGRVGLPRNNWTQTFRLCARCDSPGADLLSPHLCSNCENLYKAFLHPLMTIGSVDPQALLKMREPLEYEFDEEWVMLIDDTNKDLKQ